MAAAGRKQVDNILMKLRMKREIDTEPFANWNYVFEVTSSIIGESFSTASIESERSSWNYVFDVAWNIGENPFLCINWNGAFEPKVLFQLP